MSYTDHIFTAYHQRCAELAASPNKLAAGVAYVEGEYVPVKEARIPLMDQGFIHADQTYDVPAVWDGRYFRLDDHLDRFEASCAKMRYRNPLSRQEMRDRLVEMVAMTGIRDAYVMMIVTRGLHYIRQYAPEECENSCYLFVVPYFWIMDEERQKTGGTAIIPRTVRRIPPGAFDPTVKNVLWGDFTRALLETRDRGAQYPILSDGDGNITEGSGYNVMLVKDRKVYTARKGVLEGVTRKTVLEVAKEKGLECHHDDVPVQLAYDADEIFFVSTAGGVMPITRLDDAPVGSGEVGPITKELWKGYWDKHYDPKLSFGINYY